MSPAAAGADPTEHRSADEEYARAYATGYAEGLRNGLREILTHAARGHSVAELRLLIQSRLAQLPEEVERKRRTLLATPPTAAWGTVTRPVPPRPWPGASSPPRVGARTALLAREPRPKIAVDLVLDAAPRFSRVVLISTSPPELLGIPAERQEVHRLGDGPTSPSVESLAGELRRTLREEAPVLVYFDGIEYLELNVGADTTLRFVQWLVEEARAQGGAVVASAHAQARGPKEESLLERSFQVVL